MEDVLESVLVLLTAIPTVATRSNSIMVVSRKSFKGCRWTAGLFGLRLHVFPAMHLKTTTMTEKSVIY